MPDSQDYEAVYRIGVRRALVSGDVATLQLFFDVAVVEKYRGASGISVVRTNTVGRVRKQGGWTLDFGISPEEDMVHLPVASLLSLPEAEREHWASHAVTLPASRMFLSMRLAPGSCFDDGDLRPW